MSGGFRARRSKKSVPGLPQRGPWVPSVAGNPASRFLRICFLRICFLRICDRRRPSWPRLHSNLFPVEQVLRGIVCRHIARFQRRPSGHQKTSTFRPCDAPRGRWPATRTI